jgi:hypothetical protein
MAKKNPSVLWTVEQSLAKAEKKKARANIGVDSLPTQSLDNQSTLTFVLDIVEDATTGNLSCKTKKVKVSNTYDAQSSDPASGSAIAAAIDKLNLNNTLELGKYYSGISVVNGEAAFSQSSMDTVPTLNSQGLHNHEIPVTSDGVARALNAKVINNASLKIQKNNVDVATFTANAAMDVIANISVPTNTSDLNNDSGFITSSSIGNGTISIYQNNTLADSFTTNRSTDLRIDLDDTKNTVGTGEYTGTSGDAETAYIPFTTSNEASSQQSYVQYKLGSQAAADLFKLSKDYNDYWSAKLDGTTLAKFIEPSSGQTADQLMVTRYDSNEEIVPLVQTLGSVIKPIYLNKGVPTECYPLAVNPGVDTLQLTKDDLNHQLLLTDLNYNTYYKFVAGTPASGDTPATSDKFDQVTVGGVLFGDGFGSSESDNYGGSSSGHQFNYWHSVYELNGNTAPVFVEAPSILYSMTTLRDYSTEDCAEEIWNRHRLQDYDSCSMCRNATRSRTSPTVSSSYVSSTTLGGDVSYPCAAAIAYVPPKHWAFISGIIQEDLNGITQNFSTSGQTYYFHLSDTVTPRTTYGVSNNLHVFDVLVDGVNNGVAARKHNFSFFAYNPSASDGKYIVLTCVNRLAGKDAHNADAVFAYKVYKQIMIFKTPEYGGFDYVYDNYPVGWKPSIS